MYFGWFSFSNLTSFKVGLCGAEIDLADNNGSTPLFYAVTLGHAECTNLLLSYGADPNRQDKKGRW